MKIDLKFEFWLDFLICTQIDRNSIMLVVIYFQTNFQLKTCFCYVYSSTIEEPAICFFKKNHKCSVVNVRCESQKKVSKFQWKFFKQKVVQFGSNFKLSHFLDKISGKNMLSFQLNWTTFYK